MVGLLSGGHAMAQQGQVRVAVTSFHTRELAIALSAARGDASMRILRWDSGPESLNRFGKHECDVLLHDESNGGFLERLVLTQRFPEGVPQPCEYHLGYVKVLAICGHGVGTEGVSVEEIRKLLTDRRSGRKVGVRNGLSAYMEQEGSWSADILREKCLALRDEEGVVVSWLGCASNIDRMTSRDELIKAIRKKRNAIGFLLHDRTIPKGVRVIPVARKTGGKHSRMNDGVYPLQESLAIYVHPGSPPSASECAEWIVGPEGAAVAESHGVLTVCRDLAILGVQRLAEMKAGKGIRLSAIGVGLGESAVSDLATEYVRAKAVIQLSYVPVYEDLPAIGDFVSGGAGMRELLFLADKPSARAMDVHGEKWNALGRDKDGKPDGTGPAEHVLAGRAVAVIVNPANKLSSLTLGQLRAIFGGKVKDWNTIGGTGLATGGGTGLGLPASPRQAGLGASGKAGSGKAGPGATGGAAAPPQAGAAKELRIHAFGVRVKDPATAVFEKECLSRYKWGRVVAKKDTAAAVAAVSMDPQAIAYVDLMAIPGLSSAALTGSFAAAGQNVKVLAIQTSARTKPILPTLQNIRSATYPLSQRLYVYVHPKASNVAKTFETFMTSVLATEAFRHNNLLPLASAAFKQITKEAQAAKAKAAKPKPPSASPSASPRPRPRATPPERPRVRHNHRLLPARATRLFCPGTGCHCEFASEVLSRRIVALRM